MKVALVTGGTSGIGLASSVALCNEGMRVIVCGRRKELWDRAQEYIRNNLSKDRRNKNLIEYYPCDIRVEVQVKDMIQYIFEKYKRLDVCFNNAGVQPGVVVNTNISITDFHLDSYVADDGSINYTLPPPQPLSYYQTQNKEQEIENTEKGTSPFRENEIATSCIGTFYCLKWEIAFIERFNPKDIPVSIINTSSRNGTLPDAHRPIYAASKAFIVSLTRSLSNEVAVKCRKENRAMIRINCVSPGPIDTPLEYAAYGFNNYFSTPSGEKLNNKEYQEYEERASKGVPMGRTGKPEEVAKLVVFLADHNKSSYITGSNIAIDGGFTASPLF